MWQCVGLLLGLTLVYKTCVKSVFGNVEMERQDGCLGSVEFGSFTGNTVNKENNQ